ncbi:unnamed protein product, partial [Allacma fusca]
ALLAKIETKQKQNPGIQFCSPSQVLF